MDMNRYEYKPLQSEGGVFRLLHLKGGTGRYIECELVHALLDNEKCQYEAVSYTWGEPQMQDTISFDGQQLPITLHLSQLLRDLRLPDSDRILWIDAICINQDDTAERGSQVQQMGQVYRNARRVLFFICRPTETTDLFMDCLQELQEFHGNKAHEIDQLIESWDALQPRLEEKHYVLTHRLKTGWEHIMSQPWFSRIWILQEVFNAREGLVYCGGKSIPASIFSITPRLIGNRESDDLQTRAVMELMPAPWREYSEGDPNRQLYALLERFALSCDATEPYDRVYALLGMCTEPPSSTTVRVDYDKSDKEVISDTISHICSCGLHANLDPFSVPFWSLRDFLDDLLTPQYSQLLPWAAELGDESLVRLLLSKGASVNSSNGYMQRTGLMLAAQGGHEAVVRVLLENGAWVNAVDEYAETALLSAAGRGNLELIQLLLDHNADLESPKDHQYGGESALGRAAASGHVAAVKLLLDHGANIEANGGYFKASALTQAAERGHEAVVKLLLEYQVDIEAVNEFDGRTAIALAASGGHDSIVKWLLESGAELEARDKTGQSPLTCAAYSGHVSVVQRLLERGANIESRDETGRTPLSHAAGNAREDIVRLLLENGADIESKDDVGRSPLSYAGRWKGEDTIRLLLEDGADIGSMDNAGRSPLSHAAGVGCEGAVCLLLEKGADIESRDEAGRSALSHAADKCHAPVVKWLLENGADVQSRDKEGRSPLSYVATPYDEGRSEDEIAKHDLVAQLLVENGADIDSKDEAGLTPLFHALLQWDHNLLVFLLDRNADVGCGTNGGLTPFLWAIQDHRDWDCVIRLLLEKEIDMEEKDDLGQTALILVFKKWWDLKASNVEDLLQKGSNIEATDQYGQTALSLATQAGSTEIVKLLLDNGANVSNVVEATDENKKTALGRALHDNHVDVVKMLIDKGADPADVVEARKQHGQLPLWWATGQGYHTLVKLLSGKQAS